MKAEDFIALFPEEEDRTQERQARWFIALTETEYWYELTHKDRAEIAFEGHPAMKDCDIQEWLDNYADMIDGDGLEVEESIEMSMREWGWIK